MGLVGNKGMLSIKAFHRGPDRAHRQRVCCSVVAASCGARTETGVYAEACDGDMCLSSYVYRKRYT